MANKNGFFFASCLMSATLLCAATQASPASAETPQLSGQWQGSASCSLGRFYVTLEIVRASSGASSGNLRFSPAAGSSGPSGAYEISVSQTGNHLRTIPVRWLQRPRGINYYPVNYTVMSDGALGTESTSAPCNPKILRRISGSSSVAASQQLSVDPSITAPAARWTDSIDGPVNEAPGNRAATSSAGRPRAPQAAIRQAPSRAIPPTFPPAPTEQIAANAGSNASLLPIVDQARIPLTGQWNSSKYAVTIFAAKQWRIADPAKIDLSGMRRCALNPNRTGWMCEIGSEYNSYGKSFAALVTGNFKPRSEQMYTPTDADALMGALIGSMRHGPGKNAPGNETDEIQQCRASGNKHC